MTDEVDDDNMPLLNLCFSLKKYQFVEISINGLKFPGTPKVSCDISCLPDPNTNLTELKLWFCEVDDSYFETAADLMVANRAHINLKKLSFESLESGPKGAYSHEDMQKKSFTDNLKDSSWILFFRRFFEKGEVLTLKHLRLVGTVVQPAQMCKYITRAVACEHVETLELIISEHSHSAEDHKSDAFPETFLHGCVVACKNITSLNMSHSTSCYNCTIEDATRVLKTIKNHQLKSLGILVGNSQLFCVTALHASIISTQRNLVTLSYGEANDMKNASREVWCMIATQQLARERILQRHTLRTLASHKDPLVISKKHEHILVRSRRMIGLRLSKDALYVMAARYMPHICEYRRFGLCFDLKSDHLIVNESRYDMLKFINTDEGFRTLIRWSHHPDSYPEDEFLN